MDAQELMKQVVEAAKDRQEYERYGQRLFNALYEIDSPTANAIRATEADPFYLESNIGNFFLAILDKEYRDGLSSSL